MSNNTKISDLEKRLKLVENQLVGKNAVKKERKPSEYNKFVQDYITKEKKKSTDKNHRELFKEAAKAWSSEKK